MAKEEQERVNREWPRTDANMGEREHANELGSFAWICVHLGHPDQAYLRVGADPIDLGSGIHDCRSDSRVGEGAGSSLRAAFGYRREKVGLLLTAVLTTSRSKPAGSFS